MIQILAEDRPFEFDRPAEHGLGPRLYGDGVLTTLETREAIVDLMRDEVLRHVDVADMLAQTAGPADAAQARA